jgi:hypothetical protein
VEISTSWQEWADKRINKHDKDLYEGNGKPSITVRLDRVERFCLTSTRLMTAILLLLIGAIFTGIADLIVRSHH